MKQRIVVICPGRGTYTRETTGYLKSFGQLAKDRIHFMDENRKAAGLQTITELDASSFKAKVHMGGEHASPLIYACSLSDFLCIDQAKYEIVAITGNSMGWYIALALSGALNHKNAFHLIQTMGSMMKDKIIGGQIIYPIVDEYWNRDTDKIELVMKAIEKAGAHVSIFLGGYVVIGGEQNKLDYVLQTLPTDGKYPFQLFYHAAFHTPLMEPVSQKASKMLPDSMFQKPDVPLIDGRGTIWKPWSTDRHELWQYTLRHQVVKSYDFTTSLTVGMKEFCPDKLVLLGPGNTLGGAIGQLIIQNNWMDINSKKSFIDYQKKNPFLISMGIEDQRKLVC